MPSNCGFRRLTNIEQGTARSTSHMIATVLVTVLEGQLGNARFVEFAQPFRDHSVVLLFGGPSERKIQLKFAREIERDTAVFGGVRGREKTAMFAVLHVFAVRLQNARGRAGFRKNFAQYCKIKAHRVAQAKTFGKAGSIDVHYHVDQRLYLGSFPRFPEVTDGFPKFFQNRLRGTKRLLITPAHPIKVTIARLRDTRCQSRYE